MTKEEKFIAIEKLKPKLEKMQKSGTITFEEGEKKSLQNVFLSIYGQVNMDLNCGTCIRFYLEQLDAWYTREYSKYQQSIKHEEIIEAIESNEVKDEIQNLDENETEKPKQEKKKGVRKSKTFKTNKKDSE